MSASHINEALGAVQQLKQNLLDKQRFKGFSGPVRMVSGAIALTAAPIYHLTGSGVLPWHNL